MLQTILLVLLVIAANSLLPFKDSAYFPFIVWFICGISGFLLGSNIAPYIFKLF